MHVSRSPLLSRAAALALALLLASPFGVRAQEVSASNAAPAPVVDPAAPTFPRLVLIDVRDVLTAPLSWKAPQWERFSLGVAAVGAAALLDGTVRDAERRDHNRVDQPDRPGLRAAGQRRRLRRPQRLLCRRPRRRRRAGEGGGRGRPDRQPDRRRLRHPGAEARHRPHPSARGRTRPSTSSRSAAPRPSPRGTPPRPSPWRRWSRPSTTRKWIKGISYGTAVLVGFARVHHQAHFLSDVTAGALIGTAVGRSVVHRNAGRRHRLTVVPLLGPKDQPGMAVALSF